MKLTPFLLFLLLLSQVSIGQKQLYKVFWGKNEIGTLSVSREKQGDKTSYKFYADVEFRVLWKYHQETRFESVYEGDKMVSCFSESRRNGDLKDYHSTEWTGDRYKAFSHPSSTRFIFKDIKKSVSLFYFEEPIGLDSAYAEGKSDYCKLEGSGPNSYTLTMPNGDVNHYHYESGKLQEVEVKRSWFDLLFRRVEK